MAAGDKQPVVRVEGLTMEFHGIKALDDVGFCLGRGEFLSLFGPNGAGKTTLLKILGFLLKPTAGHVWMNGQEPDTRNGNARKEIGLVSHNSLLYDDLTVMENLEFYASLYGIVNPGERIEALLGRVVLYRQRHLMVKILSRGMQQRLSIARSLLNEPSLLLLDEPYGGLDPSASAMLTSHLKELRDQARTIIMVTHDLTRGLEVASKVGILSRGKLVFLQNTDGINPENLSDHYHRHLEVH